MEVWHKMIVTIPDNDNREIVSSLLMFNGADSVVEHDNGLDVYINEDNLEDLKNFMLGHAFLNNYTHEFERIENKNWNAEWEANFKPIEINDIHIRAEFHPKTDKREIIIQPKMAFGTGHHETTFMMIEQMNTMDFSDLNILDYGCGTGILTVFAAMQKAKNIVAIDIQEEAVENTVEHFDLNNLAKENLIVLQGDLDKLDSQKYDIILANINRHVLLKNQHNLHALLLPNGKLLLSGILKADRPLIVETYTHAGFTLASENQKGEWCMFLFTRN